MKTLGLSTPFGEVMDLSDTGMGVFRKGKVQVALGQTVTIQLSHEGTDVQVTARVARIDKVGLFRHEIGFQFINIDEETLTRLWSMTDSACSEFASPHCWIAA